PERIRRGVSIGAPRGRMVLTHLHVAGDAATPFSDPVHPSRTLTRHSAQNAPVPRPRRAFLAPNGPQQASLPGPGSPMTPGCERGEAMLRLTRHDDDDAPESYPFPTLAARFLRRGPDGAAVDAAASRAARRVEDAMRHVELRFRRLQELLEFPDPD